MAQHADNPVLDAAAVAVAAGFDGYGPPPFSPDAALPEYPFSPQTLSRKPNPAYQAVREALRLLGLDAGRFGTAQWNPLGHVVRPGDTVVLKPNFVRDFRESSADDGDCLITHGAILRAVADYAYIALQGRGRLVIADAPQNDADFDRIRQIAALDAIQRFYAEHAGIELEVYDLRPERAEKIDGVIVGHVALPGDPAGYVAVDLGRLSMFTEIDDLCHLLYGSEYEMDELHAHHRPGKHEYLISRTVLEADVVISVPKLKTHKKVGLTVNLKNLVGINGNKNWLPHHREGTPSQGGDQFCEDTLKRRIERAAVARFKRVFPKLGPLRRTVAGPVKALGRWVFGDTNRDTVRSGNWYGNDTTWRMVVDLNRILLYADASGRLHERPVRRFFSVVDGIVAGEGNGPLDATPRACGLVLAGGNPVAVDLTCAQVAGFEIDRLRMLAGALKQHALPLARFGAQQVNVHSNTAAYRGRLTELAGLSPPLRPHFGWLGHIERASPAASGPAQGATRR